jgi:NAD(P)-dependent dehydrogenase (short-subunit alcohol dehydrogenase family)
MHFRNRILAVVAVSILAGPVAVGAAAAAGDTAAPQAVLVTGASTGIGRKFTEVLAARGYVVYAGARKQQDLKDLGTIANVVPIRLDVTNPADVAAAVETVTRAGRGLYAVVNNAGIAITGPLTEVSDQELRDQLDVNVQGPQRVTRAFAPLVIASKGRIVTIGSISGILSSATLGAYSMSKHAVEAFTDSLGASLAPTGVKVIVIEPGNYRSEIALTAAKRWAESHASDPDAKPSPLIVAADRKQYKEPDEVADALLHALADANPKVRYMVVPNQQEAEYTIRQAIRELVQLNEGQPYTYDRAGLIALLDEALAGSQGRR